MSKLISQSQETFLVDNLNELDPDCLMESLQRLQKLYGSIYRLTIFKTNVVVMSSQGLANFVCDESQFGKKLGQAVTELRALIDDRLFTSNTVEPNGNLHTKFECLLLDHKQFEICLQI
jgi:hypothetical protein